jgi:hypothetical protein
MAQRAMGEKGGATFGPLLPFACSQRASVHGGRSMAVPPGSGPRSRGGSSSARASPASSPAFVRNRPGHREWGLRPGAPPPPCGTSGGAPRLRPPRACPGQVAWGTGAGPIRGVLDHRAPWLAMTRRCLCTDSLAPRAWAGERAPGHLTCTMLARGAQRTSAPGAQRTSATGREQTSTTHLIRHKCRRDPW